MERSICSKLLRALWFVDLLSFPFSFSESLNSASLAIARGFIQRHHLEMNSLHQLATLVEFREFISVGLEIFSLLFSLSSSSLLSFFTGLGLSGSVSRENVKTNLPRQFGKTKF